jgi:hypothetical protein
LGLDCAILISRRCKYAQIRIALGAFAAGLLALAMVSGSALASTGSISGKVTMASTGAEMAGVKVCAHPQGFSIPFEGEGQLGGCTHTAADGTYEFADLASLVYEIEFLPDEDRFIQQRYKDSPAGTPSDDLVKVESAPITGIDAVIQWPARLEGTVTATEDGLPATGIEVCAYKSDGWFVRCDWTAADGSYSIDVWQAGEYEIEFGSGSSGRNFAIQLYDHVDRIEEAELFPVSLSEVITGLDADLEPGGTISGHIAHTIAGEFQEEIQVCSIDATTDEIWTCVWSNRATDDYALRFLSPGPYKVVFAPEKTFPETKGEVSSGFPTQFWDYTTSLVAANVISVGTGTNVAGIDGWLGLPKPRPLVQAAPAVTSGFLPMPQVRHKCRRGFRKKVVHGKIRCVKRHKRRHMNKPHPSRRRSVVERPN